MRTKRMKRFSSLTAILTMIATLAAPIPPALADIGWSTKTPMSVARSGHAVGVVNGRVYVVGAGPTEEYDPAANTWATKAPMPTPRTLLAVGVVGNKIYAIGGNNAGTALATVEEYDPATNSWTTKAPMPTARRGLAVSVVNGKIYAIGGFTQSGLWGVATVEEYDPATNTWTAKASLPTPRYSHAAVSVNNKIYVVGGYYGGAGWLRTVEEYDPATDIWATKASMAVGRQYLAATAINDKIFAIGGWTSSASGVTAAVEQYNPITNTWSNDSSMSVARSLLGVGAVNGRIYAVGGDAYPSGATAIIEEGNVAGIDAEPAQVGATVDPAIELTLDPATLQFGNVNPAGGPYQLVRTATVRSNRNWQLFVRKSGPNNGDLTGANTGSVIQSSQLTFTSPSQAIPVEFLATDTLVNSGVPTAGTATNVNYNLTIAWTDAPDSYSAQHDYTVVQP